MLVSDKTMKRKHRDRNYFKKPASTQALIPFEAAYEDGMLLSNGKLFSKTFRLTDVNYTSADSETQESLIRKLRATIKSCTAGELSQFTIINRHQNEKTLEQLYYEEVGDSTDSLRRELNELIHEQSGRGSGIVQELYYTASAEKATPNLAAAYFDRVEMELGKKFGSMGSHLTPLGLSDRLRLLRDFYKPGNESYWAFDLANARQKGHSVKDCIAPMAMAFNSDNFLIDGKYGRVLALTEYANHIDDGTIVSLAKLDIPLVLSISFMPVPTDEAVRYLKAQQKKLDETSLTRKKNQVKKLGFVLPDEYDLEQDKKNITQLIDDVNLRDCAMVVTTITVCHTADSLEQLDLDTETICRTAKETDCEFQICREQQLDALNTVLPFGLDRISMDRTLTSESLAAFMPFNSQEIFDPHGVFYGQNSITKNLIVIDRTSKFSANGMVLGMTGGGKSFFCKREIAAMRLRYPNADFLILDPENEYAHLTKTLDGEVYHIGEDNINLFDLEIDPTEKNPLKYKTEFITTCMERILGGEPDAQSKSIIDRAVRKIYKPYLNVKASGDAGSPSMMDFKAALDEMRDPRAAEISLALERFTEGYLSVFAQPTNIYTKSSTICYSLTGLQDNVKSLGLLITLDHILNRVMSNFRKGRMTFVYADEFAYLFKDETTGEFFNNLWRRIRKYGGICTGSLQNIEEILASEAGRYMLSNSDFVVMLNQSALNAARLSQMFHLSDNQQQYFCDVEPGSGLLKVGGVFVPFTSRLPEDTQLFRLCSTKPNRGQEQSNYFT